MGGTRLVCKSPCKQSPCRRQQTRGFLLQKSIKAIAEPLVLPFEKESEHLAAWHPQSWRQLKAHQQPNYQDENKLQEAVEIISRMPPLVFAGECRNLQSRLAKCATGEAFLVQGAASSEALSVQHQFRKLCCKHTTTLGNLESYYKSRYMQCLQY